jgi:hypothetical protein
VCHCKGSVVNLITRRAWSQSDRLTDRTLGELTSRGPIGANILHTKGLSGLRRSSAQAAGGIAARGGLGAAGYGAITAASACLKSDHLDQAKRYCLGLA